MFKLSFLKNMNRNTILVSIAIIGIIITGGLIFASSNHSFSIPTIFGQSPAKIGQKAVDYINTAGLSTSKAEFVSASEDSGLIKVKIKIGTQNFDSYVTKDGKLLFPQVIDMSVKTATSANQNANANADSQTAAQAAASVKKTDSPMLEAYVVARCPFGLQMQRAMAEAVKEQPVLAQYIKVRYIGAVSGSGLTSMHGAEEATENLRQICIRDEQPAKYWNYVACQMKNGDTAGCETSTGVDSAKLSACVSDTSRGVADAQKDFALDTKYSVSGSPTMVLNGATTSESSFGGRSADAIKAMVCAAFNSQPSFCSAKLNTTEAAASFSATYADTTAAASGNSGNTGAGCAPATPK